MLELFLSFLQIGVMSIGGGYAALPLIRQQVVETHSWLQMSEFTDLITIAEMTPGPIAVNAATFVGTRIAGFPGALVATLGCVLGPCMIVLLLAWLYNNYRNLSIIQGILGGLRPAVVALIASAGLSILLTALWGSTSPAHWLRDIQWIPVCIFAAAFFVLRKWKPGPVYVMLGCGVIGILLSLMGVPGFA